MKLTKIAQVLFAAGLLFTTSFAQAAQQKDPKAEVRSNDITIQYGYNDDIQKSIEDAAAKIPAEKLNLSIRDVTQEEFEKILQKYPNMNRIYINSAKITSIELLKNITNLKDVYIDADGVEDFSPLAELTNINRLTVKSKKLNNVKWMSKLTNLISASINASSNLTSIEGIPQALGLKGISFENASISDLTPVNVLTNLEKIELRYCTLTDLSALANNKKLNDVNMYGAIIEDFSSLEGVTTLKRIQYYATKPTSRDKSVDYQSIGKLKSLEIIDGGLTNLDNINFVTELPNLKKFDVFAENVTDYTPLAKTNIEEFKIWNMKKPIDLSQLKDFKSVKKLTIDGCHSNAPITNFNALSNLSDLNSLKITALGNCNTQLDLSFAKEGLSKLEKLDLSRDDDVVGTEGLSGLTNLEQLTIYEVNKGKTFDAGFLGKLSNLKDLRFSKVNVTNFDAVSGCIGLKYVDISQADGITSIEPLKKLPNLLSLSVKKGVFKKEDLTGFANDKIKISEK